MYSDQNFQASQWPFLEALNLPAGNTSLSLVTIGDAGNTADPLTGLGAVPYTYQIGKYGVTVSEYCDFLNSTAVQSDLYGLYQGNMAPGSEFGACGIVRSGSAGNYAYSFVAGHGNFPVTDLSLGSAERFCNWLTNGQPDTGVENASTTEDGSYALNGAMTDQQLDAVTRSPNAIYVIPSTDEWYKSAYYKSGSISAGYWLYPTQSDTPPSNVLSMMGINNANFDDPVLGLTEPSTGLTVVATFTDSPGPYGTFDMGGDVFQWTEPAEDGTEVIRGGSFGLNSDYLLSTTIQSAVVSAGEAGLGFRVAEVPEPASISAIVIIGMAFVARHRRPKIK